MTEWDKLVSDRNKPLVVDWGESDVERSTLGFLLHDDVQISSSVGEYHSTTDSALWYKHLHSDRVLTTQNNQEEIHQKIQKHKIKKLALDMKNTQKP